MVKYWVKTPQWLKKLFPAHLVWDMPAADRPTVYLTFDDGPHPQITPFVLEQLRTHNAKATFFCVGDNVAKYTDIFEQTQREGHAVANHTYNHVNGWHTDNDAYQQNIKKAAALIPEYRFRPPYGRIKLSQIRRLRQDSEQWRIYMWDVLSGDFDTTITPQQCLDNVLQHMTPGSIIVFHDSDKAWERLKFALPQVLNHCTQQGWQMMALR